VTQHALGPRNPSVIGILENYGSLLKALGRGEEDAQTYALARAARSQGWKRSRNTAFIALSGRLRISLWMDHRKWQMGNLKRDLEWKVDRLGWIFESKTHRQVLEVASGFRQRIRSLQSELAQARREIKDLRHRLGSGESPLVA